MDTYKIEDRCEVLLSYPLLSFLTRRHENPVLTLRIQYNYDDSLNSGRMAPKTPKVEAKSAKAETKKPAKSKKAVTPVKKETVGAKKTAVKSKTVEG